jgi:hypothetical protein
VGAVLLELGLHLLEVVLEGLLEAGGEDGGAVFSALAVADAYPVVAEVEVFDAEAERLGESEAAAIEEMGHEPVGARSHRVKEGLDLLAGEDGGEPSGPIGALDGPDVSERGL